MAKFLAILDQAEEGCDYTIGCGTAVHLIEADSYDEAFEILKNDRWPDYESGECDINYIANGEGSLESVVLYQIKSDDDGAHYDAWLKETIAAQEQSRFETQVIDDEDELHRLAQKLGKTIT